VAIDELALLVKVPVYTADGEKYGLVSEVRSGRPYYLKVGRGILGVREVLVPLRGATFVGRGIGVPYTAEQLDGSPGADSSDDDVVNAYYARLADLAEAAFDDIAYRDSAIAREQRALLQERASP
jgi:hypothetical protein